MAVFEGKTEDGLVESRKVESGIIIIIDDIVNAKKYVRGQKMKISEFYEKTLGANLSNIRWSWGAYNPNTNQLFLRVWEDQIKTIDGIECIRISYKKSGNKSRGYNERKRHVEELKLGVEGYGVLCTARKIKENGVRTIKSFDDKELLIFGNSVKKGNYIYAQIEKRIAVKDLARKQTGNSTLTSDLKNILNKKMEATTKEALINARLGQGIFRANVLKIWGSRCCVTGTSIRDAIRASHIKPWRDCNNQERLDPKNGLPLVATLDALFDAGLITFSGDGELLISKKIDEKQKEILGLKGKRLIRKPDTESIQYLLYHHKMIFEK